MTPEERQLLSTLADRVKNTPVQQRDYEADQFLRQLVQEVPDTTYILAQTVIMQDFALRNAQAQVEELQRQLSQRDNSGQRPGSGSFLGGLMGGGSQQAAPPAQSSGSVPRVNPWARSDQPPQPPEPYAPPPGAGYGGGYGAPGGPAMQPSQTSGFLRNAAATAAGVAGGAFLFQGLSSMFSGHQSGLGGLGSASIPRDSLSETTTITNNYIDDKGGGRDSDDLQNADYDDDSDFDSGSDDDGGDYA
jgi:uncharacterized protein